MWIRYDMTRHGMTYDTIRYDVHLNGCPTIGAGGSGWIPACAFSPALVAWLGPRGRPEYWPRSGGAVFSKTHCHRSHPYEMCSLDSNRFASNHLADSYISAMLRSEAPSCRTGLGEPGDAPPGAVRHAPADAPSESGTKGPGGIIIVIISIILIH